jgi:hypothetical protein
VPLFRCYVDSDLTFSENMHINDWVHCHHYHSPTSAEPFVAILSAEDVDIGDDKLAGTSLEDRSLIA